MEKLPRKRLFVVIHTLANGLNHAIEQTQIAKEAGADGVFLIPDYVKDNKMASTQDQFYYLQTLIEKFPDFFIGVNFLRKPADIVPRIYDVQPDLFQTDSSTATGIDKAKLPNTEFFLALAFKYSRYVNLTGEELRYHCEKVSSMADVPTTSGDATGSPADLRKISEIRLYLKPDKRLGLASGTTEQNLKSYINEGVTDFLVATSLIDHVDNNGFDILNFSKVSTMAEGVHKYN